MTRHLILMRHAKSGWDDPTLDDIERPLSDRGRRQSPLLGAWLADRGHLPDVALVSNAARTRETWDIVSTYCPETETRVRPDLYLATPRSLLAALASTDARSVLVLAHNPGIAQLAHSLVDPPDDGAFLRFPTLATAVFAFEDDVTQNARLTDFTIPRRLE